MRTFRFYRGRRRVAIVRARSLRGAVLVAFKVAILGPGRCVKAL